MSPSSASTYTYRAFSSTFGKSSFLFGFEYPTTAIATTAPNHHRPALHRTSQNEKSAASAAPLISELCALCELCGEFFLRFSLRYLSALCVSALSFLPLLLSTFSFQLSTLFSP